MFDDQSKEQDFDDHSKEQEFEEQEQKVDPSTLDIKSEIKPDVEASQTQNEEQRGTKRPAPSSVKTEPQEGSPVVKKSRFEHRIEAPVQTSTRFDDTLVVLDTCEYSGVVYIILCLLIMLSFN